MSNNLRLFLICLVMGLVWPGPVRAADPYDPNSLSYGLYWFGLDNACQKFVSGEANPYFNPARPTVIFVHGWRPVPSALYPPNFTYSDGGGVNTANAWINDGWNVGIFFWNQFADEANVQDAEAKIWANDGPQRMRWRNGYGFYQEAPSGTPSAGELFYQAYLAALTEHPYTGGDIRLAGHSLGSQMVVRLAGLVGDGVEAGQVPAHLLPDRVALLDPYWSIGAKSYLGGQATGSAARQYVAGLIPQGVLVEWYRSSSLTVEPQGDSNQALEPMTFYADMTPTFVSDAMSQHRAARHLYFWAYAFASPPDCSGDACLVEAHLLSRMSNARLAAQMRSDYTWGQSEGASTASPADDLYQPLIRAGAPYTITSLAASTGTTPPLQPVTITAQAQTQALAPVEEGTLVSFAAEGGSISPRAPVQGGAALAHFTPLISGTARITAATGGSPQRVLTLTVTGSAQYRYLPVLLKSGGG